MDADQSDLHLVARRVKEAIRELHARGFTIAELHVGRNVARQLAEMVVTHPTKDIVIYNPSTIDRQIDENEGPFEIGMIGPGVPIVCLDRGDDDWCEASYRPMHTE